MSVKFTRRRVIAIAAAAAGLPLLLRAGNAQARMLSWEGKALGADASIKLYHQDEGKAKAAIAASLAEVERLEKIFSLYRADSAISALNRQGRLDNAPSELLALAQEAKELARITEGSFDPTVQPVWQLYFRHFTSVTPDSNGPASPEITQALALVDWQGLNINVEAKSISFAKPGMGLTLNGMAQGFITDRVADVLRAHGFGSMLVDMGEPRALAAKPDGSAWKIGIANPANPAEAITSVEVMDKAVATSGGYGTLFDDDGKFTHLIDPKSGKTAPRLAGVTVIAASAAKADGLSTALSVAPVEKRQAILRAAGGDTAIFVTPEGVVSKVSA
jgi:thiamine biosynthesis lipoprotein